MIAILIVWTLFLVYVAAMTILLAAKYKTLAAHSNQKAERIKNTSKLKNPGMITKG